MLESKLIRNNGTLKIPIKFPNAILSVLNAIISLTNKTRDEVLTEFIVNELEPYCDDFNSLILRVLEGSDFLEKLRSGLNRFYGYERYEKNSEGKKSESIESEFTVIKVNVKLPRQLKRFIDEICKFFGLTRERFLTPFLIGRFELIYTNPEVMLDYIQCDTKFFKDFRAGMNCYYGKEIYKN